MSTRWAAGRPNGRPWRRAGKLVENALAKGGSFIEALGQLEKELLDEVALLGYSPKFVVTDAGALAFDFVPTNEPYTGKRRRYGRQDVLFMKDRSDDGLVGVSRLSRAAASTEKLRYPFKFLA